MKQYGSRGDINNCCPSILISWFVHDDFKYESSSAIKICNYWKQKQRGFFDTKTSNFANVKIRNYSSRCCVERHVYALKILSKTWQLAIPCSSVNVKKTTIFNTVWLFFGSYQRVCILDIILWVCFVKYGESYF